jgi:hypothetical protein
MGMAQIMAKTLNRLRRAADACCVPASKDLPRFELIPIERKSDAIWRGPAEYDGRRPGYPADAREKQDYRELLNSVNAWFHSERSCCFGKSRIWILP